MKIFFKHEILVILYILRLLIDERKFDLKCI